MESILFWKDRCLAGKNIQELAPQVYALVPKTRPNKRTVADARPNAKWLEDLQGQISVDALMEYLELWDILSKVEHQHGVPDQHIWRLSPSKQHSAKSAYAALFQGAVLFEPYERIWKSWAPPNCCFFMWLVAHRRCWTADRLAKHGHSIQSRVPFVVRRMKISNIYWWAVSLQGNSGSNSPSL